MAQSTVALISPALQEATKRSTLVWRQDLEALFNHAKDRFPDVVWELGEGSVDEQEVWGHKAIVYARAPPSFQARYFSFRPNPYASSPPPTTSAFSLDLEPSRTPSPTSIAHSAAPTNQLLRLSTSINPDLFSNELEYLYTGQGFGEAFEFLYDASETMPSETDGEELRIDKLRKDLVFMWRSRLYSDVRIALTGNFSSSNHENTTAIFSSHRFILVSRSSYFHTALLAWPSKNDQQTLTLPSPPFTPASLHFTLGFIYTGTLIFSHRSYDLDTAFHIMRSATYLGLSTLYDEIQARIVQEMTHGLFHAFLQFSEYERLTSGAWGTGGCRCRQCARRAPRVLEFSLEDDVKNQLLERGARRALVGLFGEGWCTAEFAMLPAKLRDSILKGVGKRTTPQNAFALLAAAQHALGRLEAIIDAWAGDVKEMILVARRSIDDVVCGQAEACFSTPEWNDIMERDGVAFEDAERVEWIMAAVLRGVHERNAAILYQILVSSILLRPHPTEADAPMLSSTSHVRVQVEQARVDLLRWIGKRWLGIRQEGGFDQLEGWALKEISDNLEVPIEDLINPNLSLSVSSKPPRQSTLIRARENASTNDNISLHSSMRVSVNKLPMGRSGISPSGRRASSITGTSYKTMSRSNLNASTTTLAVARGSRLAKEDDGEDDRGNDTDSSRPDSKLTPAHDSIGLPPYSSPIAQSSVLEPDYDGDGDGDGDGQSRNGDYYPDPDRESIAESLPPEDSGRVPAMASLSLDHNQLPTAPLRPKKVVIKKVSPAPSTTGRPNAAPGTSTKATRNLVGSSAASVRSSAASVRSVASVSTIRKSTFTDASNSLRPPKTPTTRTAAASGSRPTSRASVASSRSVATKTSRPISTATTSDASTAFRTASSTVPRSRRTSAASATSTVSTAARSVATRDTHVMTTPRGASKAPVRTRTTSAGSSKSNVSMRSSVSVRSNVSNLTGAGATPTKRRPPPVPPVDASKLSPVAVKRVVSSASSASVRSTTSTVSTAASMAARKAMGGVTRKAGGGTGGLTPAEKVKEMARAREVEKEKEKETQAETETKMIPEEQTPAPSPPKPSITQLPTTPEAPVVDELPGSLDVESVLQTTSSTVTIKPTFKPRPDISLDHKKTESSDSTASTGSASTIKRRNSSDTITTHLSNITNSNSTRQPQPQPQPQPTPPSQSQSPLVPKDNHLSEAKALKENQPLPTLPIAARGATLDIGIPCIISSKRKRFKAYARYIGEVEGEDGPWVGVEVPFNDSWTGNGLDREEGERQWNDGTWGGIRYFEIGSSAVSEWEYGAGDDRASRRRRLDWVGGGNGSMSGSVFGHGSVKGVLKRDADQFSIDHRAKRVRSVSPAMSDASGMESRGLFVRPQQVLYVVDALGDDV